MILSDFPFHVSDEALYFFLSIVPVPLKLTHFHGKFFYPSASTFLDSIVRYCSHSFYAKTGEESKYDLEPF